jgi:hypothetical protein
MGLFWWTLVEVEDLGNKAYRLVRQKRGKIQTTEVVWDGDSVFPNLMWDGRLIRDYSYNDLVKFKQKRSMWKTIQPLPAARLLPGGE